MTFVQYTKEQFPTFMEFAHPDNGEITNSVLIWLITILSLIEFGLAIAMVV